MSYTSFANKWLGNVKDYDGVYGYQCVDLIKVYLDEEFGLKPGAWGDAIDYWNKTNGTLLTKFDKVSSSSAKQGDIVVLNGLSGNKYGHIGIATGNINSNQVEILEQNGSSGNGDGEAGNRIRTRFIDRSRVAGLLRPKAAKKSNEQLAEEVIKGLWGNGDDRKRRLTEAGYNYQDVQNIVNSKVKGQSPTPQSKPQLETYHLNQNVSGYRSSADAIARRNSNSTVPKGIYKLSNRVKGADHLIRTDGSGGWWIKV